MNGRERHICPECAVPRAADGSPSCGCTQRASDALRDARTAEAAAAEDFDPLRIRPYVGLAKGTASGRAGGSEGKSGRESEGETQPLPVVDATTAVRAEAPADTSGLSATSAEPAAADATVALHTMTPTDLSPFSAATSATDAGHAYRADHADPWDHADHADHGDHGDHGEKPRRARRTALLAGTGAVVAVVAVAGFASGLFTYETPTRNEAAPQDVRAGLEAAPTSEAPLSPTASGPTSTRSASAHPSPSNDASGSPSASATSASPSPSGSATPSPTATKATATASLAPGNHQSSSAAPVLRPGDHGAEVTELQLRLRQLNLYLGREDGVYSNQVESAVRTYQLARGVTGDPSGVYGAATRTKLEAETSEP